MPATNPGGTIILRWNTEDGELADIPRRADTWTRASRRLITDTDAPSFLL
jgi:hypothetical protein